MGNSPHNPSQSQRQMTQQSAETYTIAEAAALTGLHRNTIRMRVKLGQLMAERAIGKFGEEYRISRQTLVDAGLLAPTEPSSPPVQAASSAVDAPAPGPHTGLPPSGLASQE